MMTDDKKTIVLGPPRELAYAENRSQNPANLRPIEGNDDPLALTKFKVVSGNPTYIACADGIQIVNILCLLAEAFRQWIGKEPYIVIAGKHGNPCGAAIDFDNPSWAIRKALMGDSVAVMGGEVVTNFPIDEKRALELFAPQSENDLFPELVDIGRKNWGLDLIIAPSFSEEAVEILGKREKRKLLSNPALTDPIMPTEEIERRLVRGSCLEQQAADFLLTSSTIISWDEVSSFCQEHFATMLIAWAVCWRASSNTVALAKDNMLIGLGCGQQDRIACVRLCIDRATRAGHDLRGSVFASDAFFPYAFGQMPSIEELTEAHGNVLLGDPDDAREFLRDFFESIRAVAKLDKREGPELLIDAGCIGGVVPFDGNMKEEVKKLFKDAGVAVAFVAPENRGFSKHA